MLRQGDGGQRRRAVPAGERRLVADAARQGAPVRDAARSRRHAAGLEPARRRLRLRCRRRSANWCSRARVDGRELVIGAARYRAVVAAQRRGRCRRRRSICSTAFARAGGRRDGDAARAVAGAGLPIRTAAACACGACRGDAVHGPRWRGPRTAGRRRTSRRRRSARRAADARRALARRGVVARLRASARRRSRTSTSSRTRRTVRVATRGDLPRRRRRSTLGSALRQPSGTSGRGFGDGIRVPGRRSAALCEHVLRVQAAPPRPSSPPCGRGMRRRDDRSCRAGIDGRPDDRASRAPACSTWRGTGKSTFPTSARVRCRR